MSKQRELNFKPGAKSWEKSTWSSYAWCESCSGSKLANYQSPASDLMWSDYEGNLIDTWGRFNWTDDRDIDSCRHAKALIELFKAPWPPSTVQCGW